MNIAHVELYLLSAAALLGSPGPAIACLLAVGRTEKKGRAFQYLGGLLVGLSVAAAITVAGFFSVLLLVPGMVEVMSVAATAYLLYVAFKICTAPVGIVSESQKVPASATSGLFLGLSNPKAYIAFLTLFSSYTLVVGHTQADSFLKWILVVFVMIVVDTAWLVAGIAINKTNFNPVSERALNVSLGAMIVLSILLIYT